MITMKLRDDDDDKDDDEEEGNDPIRATIGGVGGFPLITPGTTHRWGLALNSFPLPTLQGRYVFCVHESQFT